MYAGLFQRVELLKDLSRKGADLNAEDASGNSAARLANGDRNQREASRGKQGGRTLEIQRLIGFVVVLGDHVIGQAMLFNHPATQRETQFGANGQSLLAQLVQSGLLQRKLVAHACTPARPPALRE